MKTNSKTNFKPLPAGYRSILNNPKLTQQQDWQLVQVFREDPKLFIESFLWINTKRFGLIPFKFNRAQNVFYREYQKLRRLALPLNIIVLKGRQMGISTLVEALLFVRTVLYPNSRTMVVAHDGDTAREVFQMSKIFYDQLPDKDSGKGYVRPAISSRNKGRLEFQNTDWKTRNKNPGLMSSMIACTANNLSLGAGFTLHGVHMTEYARWRRPTQTRASLNQAIADGEDILTVIESTSYGAGGAFHQAWLDAEANITDFKPIFIPWWIHEEYSTTVEVDECHQYTYDALRTHEKRWVDKFPEIRAPQIKWARGTLANKCNGNVQEFCRQYPFDAESAFMASGETMFDLEAITYYMRNQMRPAVRGRLEVGARETPLFILDENGPLEVWKQREPGALYTVGADSSMGGRAEMQRITDERAGRKRGDPNEPDYSVAVVMSWKREVAAMYRSNIIDPADFAEVLALIGKYYHSGEGTGALINPECRSGGGNASGYAVLDRLKRIYNNIARWKRWDAVNDIETTFLGWEPTVKALPILVARVERELRRGASLLSNEEVGKHDKNLPKMRIYSNTILGELSTYVSTSTGYGAMQGKKDDCVRALGLALLALDQIPSPVSEHELLSQSIKMKQKEEMRLRDNETNMREGFEAWYLQ